MVVWKKDPVELACAGLKPGRAVLPRPALSHGEATLALRSSDLCDAAFVGHVRLAKSPAAHTKTFRINPPDNFMRT